MLLSCLEFVRLRFLEPINFRSQEKETESKKTKRIASHNPKREGIKSFAEVDENQHNSCADEAFHPHDKLQPTLPNATTAANLVTSKLNALTSALK